MVLGAHNIEQSSDIISFFMDEYQPTGLGVNYMKPPTPDQADYAFLIDEKSYAEQIYAIHRQFRDRGLFLELVYRHLEPFVKQEYRFHDCGAAGGNNLNVDAKGNIGPCKSFLLMGKLALGELDATEYKRTVIEKWRKRSPIFYKACEGCSARGMCGNGCAYDAFVHTRNEMAIDARSCRYTRYFNQLFLEDLYQRVRPAGGGDWWCVPSQEDRLALLGQVRAIPNSLSYSIGHHTHSSNQGALPAETRTRADQMGMERCRTNSADLAHQ
jgi:radical SAM protein with 4Fe4S-binding SPASM domain